MHTKHVRVGEADCRIEYGEPSDTARLYLHDGKEALAECQQYGKLSDDTPTLCLTISTALFKAEQKQCAAMLIDAWHQGNAPAGDRP